MTWGAAVAPVIAMATPAAAQTLEGADLLAALRAGGYVIYFRAAIVLRDDRGAGSCGRRRASRACSGAFIHGYV